jgi:hypothetical protein
MGLPDPTTCLIASGCDRTQLLLTHEALAALIWISQLAKQDVQSASAQQHSQQWRELNQFRVAAFEQVRSAVRAATMASSLVALSLQLRVAAPQNRFAPDSL